MIGTVVVGLPAQMECSEEGCKARLAIELILTVMGTLVMRPPQGHGWQIKEAKSAPVFECWCPLHRQIIDRVPAIVGAKH